MEFINLFEGTAAPLRVSQIVLGCDRFGTDIAEETAFAIMDAYCERGGNFLDTARIYGLQAESGMSFSEAVIGKWVTSRGMAGKIVIASKGVHPDRGNMSVSRISEKEILRDFNASLEALKTDSFDIWFLHRDNPDMPVGEIIDIVSPLAEKGLVRHLGASNWTPERLVQAEEYARKHSKRGFEISQIQWSLALSTSESWEDPTLVCMDGRQQSWYREKQMPVMAFSPQARGMFSNVLEKGAESVSERVAKRFLLEQNKPRISRCGELGGQLGINPAGICLSYLTSADFPVLPIIAASNPGQIEDTLRHAQIRLTSDQRKYLEAAETI